MSRDLRSIAIAELPAGWHLIEREGLSLDGIECDGLCHHNLHRIECRPIENPHNLMAFLHEVGHVRNGETMEPLADEYEADQFAIFTMHRYRVPIPRDTLRSWKEMTQEHIEFCHVKGEYVDDEAILRYAYGKSWRQHR